jgi:NhaA family Na+:H+ antiporter
MTSDRPPLERQVADAPPGAVPALQHAARKLLGPIDRFLSIEAASGIVLIAAAVIALAWANSPWRDTYHALWHTKLILGIGDWRVEPTLHFVVNDVLMVVFFFVVGLEIKRELIGGELSDRRRAALPIAAAIGGMALPAAIYLAVTRGAPGTTAGWGVPMATDIAFAVGILALLGRRVPGSLRILLLALAIIDDLGAIVVIALFYSSGITWHGPLVALAGMFAILVCQWLAIRSPWFYILPGSVVWLGILLAGVHPTVAGVIVGLLTPMRPWYGRHGFVATARSALAEADQHLDDRERFADMLSLVARAQREARSPGERIEHALHPLVAFVVMPIFALANAGVSIDALRFDAPGAAGLTLGIVLGLVVGKPAGVLGAAALAIRLRLATVPAGVDRRGLLVVGVVSGVGFTMSLFIASLAFPDGAGLDLARFAVLIASLIAAVFGLALGRTLPAPGRGGA